MPPDMIVRRNREFCDEMKRQAARGILPFSLAAAGVPGLLGLDVNAVLEAGEEMLHNALIHAAS